MSLILARECLVPLFPSIVTPTNGLVLYTSCSSLLPGNGCLLSACSEMKNNNFFFPLSLESFQLPCLISCRHSMILYGCACCLFPDNALALIAGDGDTELAVAGARKIYGEV